MNCLIINASPNPRSNTQFLSLATKKLLEEEGLNAKVLNFENYDLPLGSLRKFDEHKPSLFQKTLIENTSEASVIFIFSPEYNWLPTPEIINLINLFAKKSNQSMFDNKVFALAGVSSGRGGRTPALVLNQMLNKVLSFLNFESVVSSKIFESQFTQNCVDPSGKLLDNEGYNQGLKNYLDFTIKIANKWFNS